MPTQKTASQLLTEANALINQAKKAERDAELEAINKEAKAKLAALARKEHIKKLEPFTSWLQSKNYADQYLEDTATDVTGSELKVKLLADGASFECFSVIPIGTQLSINDRDFVVVKFDKFTEGNKAVCLPLNVKAHIGPAGAQLNPFDTKSVAFDQAAMKLTIPKNIALQPTDVVKLYGQSFIPKYTFTTSPAGTVSYELQVLKP